MTIATPHREGQLMRPAASAGGGSLSGTGAKIGAAGDETTFQGTELPRALGYLRRHLLMTEIEVCDVKERLAYFARVKCLQLNEVFVEDLETWPAAFEALVEAALSDELSVVLIPSMLHFAVLGPPPNIKQHFEHLTRTRVLAATELLSYRPGEAAS
jgi:hypothetical protein